MMHPLDSYWVHYGDPDRELWGLDKLQPELFPDKVCQLRLKLYQKHAAVRLISFMKKLAGKPDAGKPHVRFDEGE